MFTGSFNEWENDLQAEHNFTRGVYGFGQGMDYFFLQRLSAANFKEGGGADP